MTTFYGLEPLHNHAHDSMAEIQQALHLGCLQARPCPFQMCSSQVLYGSVWLLLCVSQVMHNLHLACLYTFICTSVCLQVRKGLCSRSCSQCGGAIPRDQTLSAPVHEEEDESSCEFIIDLRVHQRDSCWRHRRREPPGQRAAALQHKQSSPEHA